jgi:hypothetical protein
MNCSRDSTIGSAVAIEALGRAEAVRRQSRNPENLLAVSIS